MNRLTDQEVIQRYKSQKPWGMSCSIDLKSCDPDIIRDPKKIEEFVIELCDLIKMKRFGEPIIVDFGEDPRVSGYSLAQLIETSLISGHFANQTNAAYIDVFSCKEYPPTITAEFCKEFFKAKEYKLNISLRE